MAINLCIAYTEVVVVVGGWIFYRQMSSYRYSLKTIDLGPLRGLGPLFSRNGAILGHSPIQSWPIPLVRPLLTTRPAVAQR